MSAGEYADEKASTFSVLSYRLGEGRHIEDALEEIKGEPVVTKLSTSSIASG